mmetsp:Transcript_65305/g.147307  ORF Transcript_65305/g.147307 Transcript_65305/m.147307 type:complete len:329 (-) Transcript_65305:485-1471(-)|eukprot:CAMPEP_0172609910 /NCGR_PEP_ID=MMETSP1068-20121228/29806_1 /TAXON_ID=35684 /ORGANISM="Pseudopedinella elastica, Strain CCMP716" /LENGTH=328 /DNA_ID=CAMNT_0013413523 /DNA_START=179 /DNA_END=1165 /DNA_ORIENTATION=+
MAFRPVHLAYLLVLLIVLESAVLYLKHPRSDTRKKAKHPGSKVHSTHRRGERRLAILTLGPSNIKAYAKRWGYDLIDVTKSVEGAASLLDAAHADPTFVRPFAILRFLPQYDWIFWHDSDSLILNSSRPLLDFVDDSADMILTASPCGSAATTQILNIGHFLVQNTKQSVKTMKSVWGLWNHSACKYGEDQLLFGRIKLCQHGKYWQGDKGGLMSVLGHCDECAKKVKYTGFRTFNSLYGCHGQGDLLVHFAGLNATFRREVMLDFLAHTDMETGRFDESRPLLAPSCPSMSDHECRTRADCDRLYHGLNTHGKCPPSEHGASSKGHH